MFRKMIGMFLILFCFNILTVHAACDYETQNDLRVKASHVTASSNVEDIETGKEISAPWADENGNQDNIKEVITTSISSIYNITEDLYITVENKNTGEITTYSYNDTDNGSITWKTTDLTHIIPYEIKVYSNNQDCQGEELNKMEIVSAKINEHSLMSYCYDLDTYYCRRYITEEINIPEEKVVEMANTEREKIKKNESIEEKKEENIWKKYKYVLFGGLGLIIIGGFIVVLMKRKQRSDIL